MITHVNVMQDSLDLHVLHVKIKQPPVHVDNGKILVIVLKLINIMDI
jgi:hypothetical protein